MTEGRQILCAWGIALIVVTGIVFATYKLLNYEFEIIKPGHRYLYHPTNQTVLVVGMNEFYAYGSFWIVMWPDNHMATVPVVDLTPVKEIK